MQDSASFWTDIKNLEEQLAKSPDSFCFARLSEVYLRVGLVEDALHVARQGVIKHPRYLSGQRALSRACHAKGLNDEAVAALMLVTEALPEDVTSQKLLGRLLVEAGNQDAACRVFRAALVFAPDDVECRIELKLLDRTAEVSEVPSETDVDDETVIEDLEILEELDILDEDQPESEFPFQKPPSGADPTAVSCHDPLSTGTLAELYVTQGFVQKALEIYSAILADNPADQVIAERVAELKALEAGPGEKITEYDNTYEEEVEAEPAFSIPAEAFFQEAGSMVLPDHGGVPSLESLNVCEEVSWQDGGASMIPLKGAADDALATFDGLLENIRKIKSCR